MMYPKKKFFFYCSVGSILLSLISCAEQEQLRRELEVLTKERRLLMEEIKKRNDSVPSEVYLFHSLHEHGGEMRHDKMKVTFRGSPALLQMPYWICLDDY